ncbi:hypothetical protein KKI24_21180 [bacterium]|nr:hypothetical protein [bacterium]
MIPTNTRNSIKYNHLRKITVFVFIVICCTAQIAVAQKAEFVPGGVILTRVNTVSQTYENFITGDASKRTALEMLQVRNKIDKNAITGSVAYEKTEIRLSFQYGLTDTLNLGISIPQLSHKRTSTLHLNDAAQSGFSQSIGDAESNGLGDIEVFGIWRLYYTDEADFQIGMTLIGDNAPLNSESSDKMPLGSGSKELSVFLRWLLYSIRSSLMMFVEIEALFVEDATIKSSTGSDVTKQQSNSLSAKLDVSSQSGSLGYGGGVHLQSIGTQKWNGISQNDGYLSYSLHGYITYGNLNLLEKDVVRNPWETRFGFEKVITGSNTPATQTLSLQFLTYF